MKNVWRILGMLMLVVASNAFASTCDQKTKDRLTTAKASDAEATAICAADSPYDGTLINRLLDANNTPTQIKGFIDSKFTPDQLGKLFPGTGSAIDANAFWKNWSVGLAILKNQPYVTSDATIVNGVVRANSTQKFQTDLLLARHWYFGGNNCSVGYQLDFCTGLVFTVGLGGNQVIDMVGGGLLIGFGGNINGVGRQNQPHNIGIGMSRRFNVKMLGDGISVNAPLPAGETQIRYQTTDINAPFLFYTYNFSN